jgi:predicted acetyltransferase
MDYQLIAAEKSEHQVVFSNLLSLYVYDLSEFFDIEPNDGGVYEYGYDWDDPDQHPFLVCKDTIPLGFAIVAQGSTLNGARDVWDMKEFFTLRSERRKGLGLWFAREMYQRFPGKWEIRIGERNKGALSFWRKTIEGLGCLDTIESTVQSDHGAFCCIKATINGVL